MGLSQVRIPQSDPLIESAIFFLLYEGACECVGIEVHVLIDGMQLGFEEAGCG